MYAIIKTVCRIGFDETSVIVGYAATMSEADYAIYQMAINAQYGEIAAGFSAVFSVCKVQGVKAMKYRLEMWHNYSNVIVFESNNKKAVVKYRNSLKHQYNQYRLWCDGEVIRL